MLKKTLLLGLILTIGTAAWAQNTVRMVSYYTAPAGEYNTLRLSELGGEPFSCALANPTLVGSIYFRNDGKLYVCTYNGSTYNWSTASSWTLSGNNLYPSSTASNVAIGGADPTLAGRSPSTRLSIFQNNTTSSGGLVIASPTGTARFSVNAQANNGWTMWDNASGALTAGLSQANGNVGIGVGTPLSKLAVAGSGTGVAQLGATNCTDFEGLSLTLNAPDCTSYNLAVSRSTLDLYFNRPSANSMFFRENNTDQLALITGGNVGIGLTAPVASVHIKSDTVPQMLLQATTATGQGISFSDSTGTMTGSIQSQSGELYFRALDDSSGTHAFYSDGDSTPRLYIASNGNVGIGTTTVDQFILNASFTNSSLSVNGDVGATGTVWAEFFEGPSDRRLKENIHPITNAVDKVRQLNGVNFKWKKDGRPSMGLIAQNVEAIFPQLVRSDANGIKSVAYDNLVGVLIEAIKEQQKEIAALKNELKQITP